ncbi:Na+/H+ antiporter subunit C [Meridianimarinicoccus roseus]|jgi:multicomponent Na+:H+ antiporter subunit C|uniref:Na+/H+ antiporter subunit C n=1 Tax=Meridianimarinicoccus roseus TaxID=2072018 RepID=A0A2V2L7K2_9RHOB|nr:NADH-quinone oxidoreductase subunit K [Meridianimarinicoccus roseus]PWR01105.1 Na+/H+ antiporter subunit C [Meridianimarinicoccus roseus]
MTPFPFPDLTPQLIYHLAGAALVGIALYRGATSSDLLTRILALNVLSVGIAAVFVAAANRGAGAVPDPVPHAFVLTGIVVLVAVTAALLALAERIDLTGAKSDD